MEMGHRKPFGTIRMCCTSRYIDMMPVASILLAILVLLIRSASVPARECEYFQPTAVT